MIFTMVDALMIFAVPRDVSRRINQSTLTVPALAGKCFLEHGLVECGGSRFCWSSFESSMLLSAGGGAHYQGTFPPDHPPEAA